MLMEYIIQVYTMQIFKLGLSNRDRKPWANFFKNDWQFSGTDHKHKN